MKDQCIGANLGKSENKNTTDEYRYFLESNFVYLNILFVLIYSNEDDNAKKVYSKKVLFMKMYYQEL